MQVILKATTACNASCRYCSAVPDVNGGFRLKADELGPLFETFRPWLAADPTRTLCFVWHGGEPLLPGLPFFRRAADEQSRVFGPDAIRVANRLQSNLTLLDDAWVAFLKGFVKSIGTSFDLVEGVRTTRHGGSIAGAVDRGRDGLSRGRHPGRRRLRRPSGARSRARETCTASSAISTSGAASGSTRSIPKAAPRRVPTDDLAITAEEYGDFLVEVAEAVVGRRADSGGPAA